MFAPPAFSGPVRLAVLPIENATGDEDMAWVSTGLAAFMDRLLQDNGIDTVGASQVSGLAGDAPVSQLTAQKAANFATKLRERRPRPTYSALASKTTTVCIALPTRWPALMIAQCGARWLAKNQRSSSKMSCTRLRR